MARFETALPVDLAAVLVAAGVGVVAVMAGWPDAVRVPLGLALVLFAPGYAMLALLFPQAYQPASAQAPRKGLDGAERAVLSIGVSMALTVLVALILDWRGVRLTAGPVLGIVALLTAVLVPFAVVRRAYLPSHEVLRIGFGGSTQPPLRRPVLVALVSSLLIVGAATAFVIIAPDKTERFTEFYILGETDRASCYPAVYTSEGYAPGANERCPDLVGNVTVGLVNHEGRETHYWVRAVWSNETVTTGDTRIHSIEEWQTIQVTLPSVPVDVSLGTNFTPQHEIPLRVPPPPGPGLWRLTFQLFLQPPPSTEPTHAYLGSADRRTFLWIEAP
ncbi:MAG TPA: DUF1616 domain-containing protein [Candidatus Thermoplasmatota archaeon]|nr:DUF1616 domain-containing protein [Candidatus Thermoplasmatota archaeon]